MVKWIDITEQLPTSSKEVLVRCKHSVKHYGIAKYKSGSWWESFADDSIKGWAAFEGEITHWMDIENLQEPASEELEEATERYACKYSSSKYGYAKVGEAFKAGAQWDREQMMKDAFSCEVDFYDGKLLAYTQGQLNGALERIGVKVGEEVKILILPSDNK